MNAERFHWNPPNIEVNDSGIVQLIRSVDANEIGAQSEANTADAQQNVSSSSNVIDSNENEDDSSPDAPSKSEVEVGVANATRTNENATESQITSPVTPPIASPVASPSRNSLPLKTEPRLILLNSSIITLSSDDSIQSDGASSDDEFDELRTGLAYNSDDDVEAAINKEFDYLVSLGISLPAPIIVKIDPHSNAELNVDSASVEATAQPPNACTESVETIQQPDNGSSSAAATSGHVVKLPIIQSASNGAEATVKNEPALNPLIAETPGVAAAITSNASNQNANNFDSVGGFFEIVRQVT